jgi:chlorobactene glucosyltransferase
MSPAGALAAENIALALAMFAAAAGVWIATLTMLNAMWMLHTTLIKPKREGPLVSILIPARDEEERIGACLDSLLGQDYQRTEIIVYDDDSTDATPDILADYAARFPGKIRAIRGKLEEGWYGKPHAMQRLSEAASGGWLFFTDADTVHKPDSVSYAAGLAEHYRADLVSGYALLKIGSFGEAVTVPSIYLLTMALMPTWLSHRRRMPALSHAIGQVMFFKAETYRKIGGYAAVAREVSEDVRIARLVKRSGGRALFGDLKEHVSCRMYEGYRAAINGFSKNVYDYFNKKFALLLAVTVLVPVVFFLPLLGALWLPETLMPAQPWCRLASLLVFYAWGIVTVDRALPWYIPLVYPLIFVNTLSAAWRAFRLFATGRAVAWKGRMVK